MILKILKNEKGFSLPLVLVIFAVLTIFLTSSLKISRNNAKQVQNQESNMRAYYVARSGIDIVYAALLKADNTYETKADRFIEEVDNGTITNLTEDDIPVPSSNPIGYVDVKVEIIDKEIKITGDAKVNDSNQEYTLAFYFPKNLEDKNTRWEKEN